MLLDLRLPDIDGFDVARELRRRSAVPIIMTTARGEEVDIVVGLEIGADDYLVKPFGFRQLLARIRAVSRRAEAAPAAADDGGLAVGRLEVNVPGRLAWLEGRELDLTPREFDLLALLASRPGWWWSARRSSASCGAGSGTARPRRSTCTSAPCGASSATRRGSRPRARSASA